MRPRSSPEKGNWILPGENLQTVQENEVALVVLLVLVLAYKGQAISIRTSDPFSCSKEQSVSFTSGLKDMRSFWEALVTSHELLAPCKV